jgi:peptide deformylase
VLLGGVELFHCRRRPTPQASDELNPDWNPPDLKIVYWPDPRLLKVSARVETIDEKLKALTTRMFELMREHKGVGLAAPQVGVNLRLFVMNATGDPADDRVYVNPEVSEPEGEEEAEEGCLSLPGIHVDVLRCKGLRMVAQDLEGKTFEQTEVGYIARIWQHEIDHLNGKLLTDRMGPLAKLAHRKVLKELEADYAERKK